MFYVENNEKFCQFCLKTTSIEGNFRKIDANIKVGKEMKKIYELFNTFGDDHGVFRECEEDSLICGDCIEQLVSTMTFYEKCVQTQEIIKMKQNMVDQLRESNVSMENSGKDEVQIIRIPTPPLAHPANDHRIYVKNVELFNPVIIPEMKNVFEPLVEMIEEGPHFFECVKCVGGEPISFETQSEYLIHLSEFHEIPCIICETCGAVFNTTLEIDAHRLKHYIDCDKTFNCNRCIDQFSSAQALEYHVVSHSVENYCLLCLKPCENVKSLVSHLNQHIDGKVLDCIYCPLRFRSATQLNQHINESHVARRFACDKCQERFITKDLLRKHQSDQHEEIREVYNCNLCKKTFESKTLLTDHLETHLNGTKFIPVHTTNHRATNNNKNFHNSENSNHQRRGVNNHHQLIHQNRNFQHQNNNRNFSIKINNNNYNGHHQGTKKPVKRLLNKGNVYSRLG